MAKKSKLLVVLIVVGLAVPAKLAEAVSIGQICQNLGKKSTAQVKKVKVPVICRLVSKKSKKKVWVRTAARISTTSTTSTTSTSTTVPAKDFIDSVESVELIESYNSSLHRMTFSDGVIREYKLVLPVSYDPLVAYPLAIGLHGLGGTTSTVRTQMNLEKGSTSAIVAYPQGLSIGVGTSSAWNAGTCCSPATLLQTNDIRFISRLIDSIENQFQVDKSRVWAFGFSNGGMMAYRLGCEISDQITGVGVGAGAFTIGDCNPTKKFSVIHIHGDLDDDVPLNGGGRYNTRSAVFSIEFVAQALGCTKDATGESANSQLWKCPDSMDLRLLIDINQDHDWNSNWTEIMVSFLQSHPRK